MQQMITLRSWPRAILHLDADAFFASVEQAVHPELKGKPIVTGAERGIVSAASYEAKALGVQRGVSLTEAAQRCPQLIMVPSDYETYGLFSKRLFAIVRRFTPDVEEYSIDECFADLTGLRRTFPGDGYQGIAKQIQAAVLQELDIGVSVGISLTKSLAKLCSKFRKPRGFTAVPGSLIHILLERTPLEKVWGFGPNTVAKLHKLGCKTALDFVRKPRFFAEDHLGKVGVDIWSELRGEAVYPLVTTPKTDYASISKHKTFSPASSDPDYLFAQAVRNLESACIKARRYDLATSRLVLCLRQQDFRSIGCEARVSRPTNSPLDLAPVLRTLFEKIYRPGVLYRASGVVLSALQSAHPAQGDLFEDPIRVEKTLALNDAIDDLGARFGKHTVFMSSGLFLGNTPQTRATSGRRGGTSWRASAQLPGETSRKHLRIPLLSHRQIH